MKILIALKIFCILFFLIPINSMAQEKLFPYYGEKLEKIPPQFHGEWVLDYYDSPGHDITTDFFKKIPAAKNKILRITEDAISFADEKCQIKRIHKRNPKLSFFDVLVYEGDPRNYPDYFQNKFLKNGCLKDEAAPYHYTDAKKAAEFGIIIDCKNDTSFIPSDLILLGRHEILSSLEDFYVCYRKK